jgi:hypothetical protein
MDPAALATAAVSLIAAFLGRAGEQAADQAAGELGHATVAKLRGLYEAVKRRVARDSFAQSALERLEQQPENERRRGALEDAVAEVAEADPAFRHELARVLEEVQAAAGDRIEISDSGAVAIHGDVRMRGTYVAGRDMRIGGTPPPAEPGR